MSSPQSQLPVRKTLDAGDGTISYLEWEGAAGAPVLIFSHANGFNASTYKSLLAPLAGEFRIIAWDMRGHGLTTLPLDRNRLRGWQIFRDDLLRFIDRLDAKPAVLAGHSLGATATVLAAAVRSNIGRALVLAEPVMPEAPPFWRRLFGKWEGDASLAAMALRRRNRFASREEAATKFIGRGAFRTWPPDTIADYVDTGLLPDENGYRLACPPEWEAAIYAAHPVRIERLGSRIAAPVTILYGTTGSAASKPLLKEFAERHRNTRLVCVEGGTHFLPMEHPQIVQEEIRRAAGLSRQ
jgi:pimeloyl-ACP methyl ester carboxylesterase